MKYSGMIKNDVVNGQNVCVSFWVQGCPHHCEGCHNPETWDFNSGIERESDDLIKEVLFTISQNGVQRNLSILGGEPLCAENLPFVCKLTQAVKQVYPSIKIYVWTGYTFEDLTQDVKSALAWIDYLIDGPFELLKRDVSLPLTGSSNQRIIDVRQSLKQQKVVLHILNN